MRAPTAASLAALERVRTTATGLEPADFETAVCALFATLGFAATHVGGYDAPDGYLDAPLGPLAYRVMLECKTGSANAIVTEPNVVEAAKYRAAYGASFCALVGPAFGAKTAFASELHTHGVSAWTVDDLAAVVQAGFDPAELRALFAPGLVADVVDDAVWSATHGEAKRVGAICDAIEAIAVRAQRVAIGTAPGDAPLLDVDAAMMLLDEHFAASESAARCRRRRARCIRLAHASARGPCHLDRRGPAGDRRDRRVADSIRARRAIVFEDIEELSADRLSHPEQALVVAHYQLAAPLLEANFSHVPLVSSYHPQGLGTPAVFKQRWKPGELPA